MVSTVLFKKNGVITESRFRKMTPAQWLFHFIEISQNSGDENKILLDLMEASSSTLSRDIRILYTLVGDNKEQIINALDIADDLDKKARNRKKNDTPNEEETKKTNLTTEDEELLEFMYSTPKTIKMPKTMVKEVSYILESKDINEILDDFTELPDKNYSTIRRNKTNEEVQEDIVEVQEDIVEVQEDIVEVQEDIVEVQEDIVEVQEDIVEVQEDESQILIVDDMDKVDEQLGMDEIEEF